MTIIQYSSTYFHLLYFFSLDLQLIRHALAYGMQLVHERNFLEICFFSFGFQLLDSLPSPPNSPLIIHLLSALIFVHVSFLVYCI